MGVERCLENVKRTGIQVDRFIDNAERAGSNLSVYPFINAVAGALKITGGIIQTITAVVCAILCSIPALCVKNGLSLMRYCFTHILHGMGNILAGTLEAIPLAGTELEKIRKTLHMNYVLVADSELEKFMPYNSLREDDIAHNRIHMHV